MNKKVFFLSLILMYGFVSIDNTEALDIGKVAKVITNNNNQSLDISKSVDELVKKAVKTGTDELDKNVKSIVDDVRGDVKSVISDAKKDLNSVVSDAKNEINSVQGTIKEVKTTIYSVKASFDKIILLLKILIGLVGILITLLCFSFLNKIIKILKLTKSVVNIAKGKAKIEQDNK